MASWDKKSTVNRDFFAHYQKVLYYCNMVQPDAHTYSMAAPELVRRIRSGDHSAYELFYRMEFLNLVHFIHSYIHDQEKARDMAQETLLTLWEHRGLLDPERNIRSFVFTIARNKTLNELRRMAPTEQVHEALALLEHPSVEENIHALELSSLIEKVWESLPKSIGETFSLSRRKGLKNKEIALQEGISEKTVEYRIRVALGHFRKLFEDFSLGRV